MIGALVSISQASAQIGFDPQIDLFKVLFIIPFSVLWDFFSLLSIFLFEFGNADIMLLPIDAYLQNIP